ncbi:MAG: ATP-dependent DNA helicase RecG [Eubacteriales bacterium]
MPDLLNLTGIGPKTITLLKKLNIFSVEDLVYFLPRDYTDLKQKTPIFFLKDSDTVLLNASLIDVSLNRIRKNLNILKLKVSDGSSFANVYYFNQAYLKDRFKTGDKICVLGKVKRTNFEIRLDNPEIISNSENLFDILPIYRLTAGLTQKKMRELILNALKKYEVKDDMFSDKTRKEYGLSKRKEAFFNVHFPKDKEMLALAKRRLLFEDLMLFNAFLYKVSSENKSEDFIKVNTDGALCEFFSLLPYEPTSAQRRICGEICEDMQTKRMERLIQGDVGCGKTMIAFFAMYLLVRQGYMAAMMAPTEVLSRQHYEEAKKLFESKNIRIELLVGSMSASEKKEVKERINKGEADLVFGTHALFYENVVPPNLGLVIADEQHRFGVSQRAAFEAKGTPHVMIMSATPIPRTLAMVLYKNLDISIVDEMPPLRKKVKTFIVSEQKRLDMYGYIKKSIVDGSQCYVVCPLIEENEDFPKRSAADVLAELSKIFPKGSVAMLHGKLSAKKKQEIINGFYSGEIKVLVATTVVEVGVNVPNATIMVIENAEMFGLSTLHQLRGRVGRGEKESFCFLVTEADTGPAYERLSMLVSSNDGFLIAQKDLEMRGPGEFLGSRQNGTGDLYMTHLIKDMRILNETQEAYMKMLENGDSEEIMRIENAAEERFADKFDKVTLN